MKKRYQFILLAIFILSNDAIAQHSWTIKLYQNTDYRTITEHSYLEDREETTEIVPKINFNRLSLALHLDRQRKWEHELEFSYSQQVVPLSHKMQKAYFYEVSSDFFAGQYEIIRNLIDNNSRFNFLLGSGIFAYWTKYSQQPTLPNVYYGHQRYMGSSINIIPHFTFKLVEQILLDLNLKVGLYDIRQYQRLIDNPSVPLRQQGKEEIQHDFFPKAYSLRFGIGYQIK